MNYCLHVVSCLFSFSLPALAENITSVTIAYDEIDYFPWALNNKTGLDFILLEKVDEALPEVTFTFVPVPWKRCLALVEQDHEDAPADHRAQGCMSGSFKDERAKFAAYPGCHVGDDANAPDGTRCQNGKAIDTSLMLHLDSYTLYALNSDIKVGSGFEIAGLSKNVDSIAVPLGYSIGEDLTKAGWKMVDNGSRSTEQNFGKLIGKQVSAVAGFTLDGDRILAKDAKNKKRFTEIKAVGTLVSKAYYVLFSHHFVRTNRALAETIWRKIAKFRNDPSFKDEAAKWIDQRR